jgi:curli biogenesis system outer membrane secretion channel CsgG
MNSEKTMARLKRTSLLLIPALLASASALARNDDDVATAVEANRQKNAPVKTITSFSQALRCMDELFLAFGKQGIIITSAGMPDETGKVNTGTKEMLISTVSKMTLKSGAFEFIDFHSRSDDLATLFASTGDADRKRPDYYIRGSITQMDDNAVRTNKGVGFSLPFLDLGASKDDSFDVISMDMSIGEVTSRRILPSTSTSNTMVIKKSGRSGEAGGKLFKLGMSFNVDVSRSEGLGATTRALVELGLIETLGKFTQVPYWRCLDTDLTNPAIRSQALEDFESMKDKDRILFVQRKLGGSMNRYHGPMNGFMNDQLKAAVSEYQASIGLVADGKINFDVYASLIDDTQNQLAAVSKVAPEPQAYVPPQPSSQPVSMVSAPVAGGASVNAAPFMLNLQTDRGGKPTFKVGEFLNMSMSMNGNGTAYCYYEDVSKTTARIFPNQFQADAWMKAGSLVRLAGGGFKIRFDQPGRERIACIAADRELLIPSTLVGARDLTPLKVRSVDDIVGMFKQNNPTAVSSVVDITVTN